MGVALALRIATTTVIALHISRISKPYSGSRVTSCAQENAIRTNLKGGRNNISSQYCFSIANNILKEMKMKNIALFTFAVALAAPAAWAATTIDAANAPQGAHVQSGSPDCQVSGFTVTCSSYDLAGVGRTNATATLSATYSGTVLCTNPAGNIAPGQTQNPTIATTSGQLSPKNGRLTVPSLTSASQATIEAALLQNTSCPNRKWTKSMQSGSIQVVGFTYTLTFAGYSGPYILITD